MSVELDFRVIQTAAGKLVSARVNRRASETGASDLMLSEIIYVKSRSGKSRSGILPLLKRGETPHRLLAISRPAAEDHRIGRQRPLQH
jgi:hypothetical protein